MIPAQRFQAELRAIEQRAGISRNAECHDSGPSIKRARRGV
jgi:hypothetical protein